MNQMTEQDQQAEFAVDPARERFDQLQEAERENTHQLQEARATLQALEAQAGRTKDATFGNALARVQRLEAEASNLGAEVLQAQADYRQAVATHVGSSTKVADRGELKAQLDQLQEQVTQAVAGMVAACDQWNSQLAVFRDQLTEAGLTEGSCDPFAPAYVGSFGNVHLHGEVIPVSSYSGTVANRVTAAVTKATGNSNIVVRGDV